MDTVETAKARSLVDQLKRAANDADDALKFHEDRLTTLQHGLGTDPSYKQLLDQSGQAAAVSVSRLADIARKADISKLPTAAAFEDDPKKAYASFRDRVEPMARAM